MDTSKKTAAETTAERVRLDILSGRVAPGSDLPGERSLSEQLGVSRLTLRSALTTLEAEGLVQSVHGSGTRVLDYREHGGVDLLGHLVDLALSDGRVPVRRVADLLELRRILAVELLGTVAERASESELAALAEQLGRLEGAVFDPDRYMVEDLAFARLVVRASGNLAMELLFNTVVRIIAAHPTFAIAFRANTAQAISTYRRLIELVGTRDGRRVRRVARRIITGLDRRTIERLEQLANQVQGDA